MPTLAELIRDHAALAPADEDWVRLLVSDWQLVSDLSFADLVLWVRVDAERWHAVAHVRPTTGQTVYFGDQVGRGASATRARVLEAACAEQRILRERDTEWAEDLPIREETIPVVRCGRVVAVLTRHTNLSMMRTPSRLELTYLATADALLRMISRGEFPHSSAPTGLRRGAPRVGDGVIRLDVDGAIEYASPNAVSALHRIGHLGEIIGATLAQLVTSVLRDTSLVDEGLPLVLTGRQPWRTEVANAGAVISMRAIPLSEAGQRFGAILLVRDISELRRREQELMTKDATIREIHHRVKNNLQSVAALLRLQARRMPDAQGRAALEEAVRRVGTIALVHETLSHGLDETVPFDEVADVAMRAVAELTMSGPRVVVSRTGSFGQVRAEDATSLAMVVSELVHNAVEHGLAATSGSVTVNARRRQAKGGDTLVMTVIDDGVGLPGGVLPPGQGLGSQIVQSLVQDLRGKITWSPNSPSGTKVRLTAQLRRLDP
ncbi:MAG: histidine kinase N-terminal domain-containing protein [Dermatophilaceae bacterium]|nr:histidine kinase N-terminal domain-containing protein [Dermatophilaceae bacterium]MBP9918202.1 histidine kinase N-terminal domain-containing protein [Dermatophilaceae bacterium]